MKRLHAVAASLVAASIGFYSAQAHAILGSGVIAGLQAQGTVRGATPETLTDEEVTVPFTRSFVSVANSGTVPDPFEYAASADIGTLELKVFGRYTNSSGSPGNIEIPFMQVTSHVRDIITLASPTPDEYQVTLQLLVDGSIATSGGTANALANASLSSSAASDARTVRSGTLTDTLSVMRTLSGPLADMEVEAFLSFNVFQVDPGATVTGDFGSTAKLQLVLPQGVSLVGSTSGTFAVPIPEPHAYVLLLAGFLVVGAAARRRGRN